MGSAALLGLGLWVDNDGVTVIGAVGIVASLVLARMTGPFEIGIHGVKGTLGSEILAELLQRTMDEGYPTAKIVELYGEAVSARSAAGSASSEIAEGIREAVEATQREIEPLTVHEAVGRTIRHEEAIQVLLENVAQAEGWEVERWSQPDPSLQAIDWLVTKGDRSVALEAVAWWGTAERPVSLRKVVDAIGADKGFLIVRTGTPTPPSGEPKVEVVELPDLTSRLFSVLG